MKKDIQTLVACGGVAFAAVFTMVIPFVASAQIASNSSSSVVTLSFGAKDVAVAVLQKLLIKDGYLSVAAPTGYFGSATQSALEAFQKANNLPVTGMFTISANLLPDFFGSVGSSTPMALGTTGASVQSLQSYLVQSGYLKINAPTQYFGTLTQSAVEAFQAAHSLPQTGVVDQMTFSAMNGK